MAWKRFDMECLLYREAEDLLWRKTLATSHHNVVIARWREIGCVFACQQAVDCMANVEWADLSQLTRSEARDGRGVGRPMRDNSLFLQPERVDDRLWRKIEIEPDLLSGITNSADGLPKPPRTNPDSPGQVVAAKLFYFIAR
jgi:hypothetical protein